MNKQELIKKASDDLLRADEDWRKADADRVKYKEDWQRAYVSLRKAHALPDDYVEAEGERNG